MPYYRHTNKDFGSPDNLVHADSKESAAEYWLKTKAAEEIIMRTKLNLIMMSGELTPASMIEPVAKKMYVEQLEEI